MPDCKSCKDARRAVEPVPYIIHEGTMARMERTIKRLWILCIVLVAVIVGTNAAWLWWNSQFETIETTVTQETADGYNNYIGNDGDIVNGETDNID